MTTLADRLAAAPLTAPTSVTEGWTPHPKFPGVAMKKLAGRADTDGAFTTLMVRVEPGKVMLPHVHPENTEQHLVVEGEGTMVLNGREYTYAPGALIVIPKGIEHSVAAGARGIVLMALFSPACD